MDKVIAKPWLSLQCRMIPGVRHAVFAAHATGAAPGTSNAVGDGTFSTLETWPEGDETPPDVLATLRAAMASERAEVREPGAGAGVPGNAHWIVACPLRRSGAVCGGVAVEVEGLTEAQVPVVTQLMEWGSAWPAFLADQDAARRLVQAEPALGVAAAALEPEDSRAAAVAVANALAREFAAGRAALGAPGRNEVRVGAISGRAVFDRRSDRVRRLEAAMNEACDQDATLVWPVPADAVARVGEAHARLSAGADHGCVCTVPLRANGRTAGALTLLRPREQPFDGTEIARLEGIAALLGPALAVRRDADRGALARAVHSGSQIARRLFGAGHLRLKLGATAGAALIAFLAFASGTHQVAASAVLAGSVERALVAPVDGFVASANARAGSRVRTGEVLATLDDRRLRLERQRWQSQHDELTNEYHRALGALDRGATRVLQAQIAQAGARLALAEGELERTRIVAPFDALVVSGDLSQSLGSPVSRGDELFRLAPLDGYRVILEVEEGDVPAVRAGATGRLVLAALPGEQSEVRVERVNGMANAADGRNVLEVEAALSGYGEHLRPGMKGVARLDAGQARLLWIWTHGLLDRLRLWLWAWSPVA